MINDNLTAKYNECSYHLTKLLEYMNELSTLIANREPVIIPPKRRNHRHGIEELIYDLLKLGYTRPQIVESVTSRGYSRDSIPSAFSVLYAKGKIKRRIVNPDDIRLGYDYFVEEGTAR